MLLEDYTPLWVTYTLLSISAVVVANSPLMPESQQARGVEEEAARYMTGYLWTARI